MLRDPFSETWQVEAGWVIGDDGAVAKVSTVATETIEAAQSKVVAFRIGNHLVPTVFEHDVLVA